MWTYISSHIYIPYIFRKLYTKSISIDFISIPKSDTGMVLIEWAHSNEPIQAKKFNQYTSSDTNINRKQYTNFFTNCDIISYGTGILYKNVSLKSKKKSILFTQFALQIIFSEYYLHICRMSFRLIP